MPHATCTVCTHHELQSIEVALKGGGSVRAVAKRFGLSPAAVDRHKHHDEYEKTRVNTGEIARINAEIRKLHLAQTNARKRRDNELALQIARELRNWFILKRKAELASGTASDSGSQEQLSPGEAVLLARSVIEARLDDPAVREWLLQLVERIRDTAAEPRATGSAPEGHE
jgi:transposase-like protein